MSSASSLFVKMIVSKLQVQSMFDCDPESRRGIVEYFPSCFLSHISREMELYFTRPCLISDRNTHTKYLHTFSTSYSPSANIVIPCPIFLAAGFRRVPRERREITLRFGSSDK